MKLLYPSFFARGNLKAGPPIRAGRALRRLAAAARPAQEKGGLFVAGKGGE